MSKKKYRIPPHLLFELMRVHAKRRASQIAAHGWRPSQADLRDLRQSLKDARTYRAYLRAWRTAGFRLSAIMRIAGRTPANRSATIRQFAAAQMEMEN